MKLYAIHIETVARISEDYFRAHMPLRLKRADRYLRREDRLRCLGAGTLLHRGLEIQEQEIEYGPQGKPFVPGKPAFNLSHGGNWVVLACGDTPVGVDIEPIDPANLSVAPRVFTPQELDWLQENPQLRFHVLWTLKESIMKAAGLGLQLDPLSFTALPIGGPHTINNQTWHTAWLQHGDHVIAWASALPPSQPEWLELSPEGNCL